MSFITRQLNSPCDLVSVHCLPLLNVQTHYIVITRRHAIEIHYINIDNTLTLRNHIPVWDTVVDSKPFTPLELPGTWLLVAMQSNKVLLVGFHSSTEEAVVEEYDLNKTASSLSIEPGTLTVDSQKHFSFYTQEGSLVVFKLHRAKDLKNFEKAFKGDGKKTPKLFEEPEFHTITRVDRGIDRTPMNIVKIENHYEESLLSSYSVIYRDDVYQYYSTFISTTSKNDIKHQRALPLPDEISPILLPFERNLGVFIFSKSAVHLRFYDPVLENVSLGDKLQMAKDTTVELKEDDSTGIRHASKVLFGKEWKITSAIELKRRGQGNMTKLLVLTSKGELYLSKIHYTIWHNEVGGLELMLNKWSLKKFHDRLVSASHICQIDDNLFLLSSPRDGLRLIKIDWDSFSFKTTFETTHDPPILDFNITGTVSPKIQVVGGNDLNSGLIRTEFKGYESTLRKVFSVDESGVTEIWKLGDIYGVSGFTGSRFFGLRHGMVETIDLPGLEGVDGAILDIKQDSAGGLLVITESGLYRDSKLMKTAKISQGIVFESEFIYFGENTLKFKGQSHKLTEEVASISAIRYNKNLHVLIGTWDGSVFLYTNGSKKAILKKSTAIKSVVIKKLNENLFYIVGGGHGQLTFIQSNNFTLTEFNLGYSPVDVVDYTENTILAYNAENTILFELTDDLTIKEKGYLKVQSPEIIKSYDHQLFYLKNQCISQLDISNENKLLRHEQKLNRLVRKSIKFKNHLELSIFVTITEKMNEVTGKMVMHSQLEVIDNNTLKLCSSFKFEPGLEVTDVVNTRYRKDLIDTYEEENIQLGYENVLSQCFVVSCVPQSRDEIISPLMLFTVDENGKLKYECSSTEAKVTFYSLASHANRLVVGAGNAVAAYKVVYSVTNSKFALNRLSEYYQPRYFVSIVKSVGPDVLIGDVVQGAKLLNLKIREDVNDGLVFKLEEATTTLEKSYFLTTMEMYENLVIIGDSLENISIQILTEEGVEVVSKFNLGDKVNVIKRIDRIDEGLTKEVISTLFNEEDLENDHGLPCIVPLFVVGTVSGGIHLISLITEKSLVTRFEENEALKRLRPLTKSFEEDNLVSLYAGYRGFKTPTNFTTGLIERYTDGDMVLSDNANDMRIYIENYCKLL